MVARVVMMSYRLDDMLVIKGTLKFSGPGRVLGQTTLSAHVQVDVKDL